MNKSAFIKHTADIVRRVIGYILALAMTAFFALYLSGRTGTFIFFTLILLPPISVILTLIMRKYISVSAEVSETEVYKGSNVMLKLKVRNTGFLPSPPVILKHHSGYGLVSSEYGDELTVNVFPKTEEIFETEYKAVMWCYSQIGLEDVFISDYTGMIRFRLPGAESSEHSFDVKIIPDIKNISSKQDILKAADEAASRNDDSEDTADTRAVGFTGVPGYEHREYEPGDPLKRVNWKLSAKRGGLMVRLDDSILSKRHSVILDGVNSSGDAALGEICGETMLGILSVIIRSGFESKVRYYSGGTWLEYEVSDEMSLESLRMSLAGYRYEKRIPERIPYRELSEIPGGAGAVLFFTPCLDAELSGQLSHSGGGSKGDITVTAAAASVSHDAASSGVWLISADGSMEIL